MKCLVLSHFDRIRGPKTFITIGDKISTGYLDDISRYMDYHDSGYFVHEYREIKSANRIFLISNPFARGGSEILMISVVLIDENADIRNFYALLEQFVDNCKNIDKIHNFLYLNKKSISGTHEGYKKIEDLMYSTYNSLPLRPDPIISDAAKIIMLKLNKTT